MKNLTVVHEEQVPNILTQKVMLQEGFVLLGQVNLQPSDKQLLASYNNILACLGLRALHVFLIHRTFGQRGNWLRGKIPFKPSSITPRLGINYIHKLGLRFK